MNWFKEFWKRLTTPMPRASAKRVISDPQRSPLKPFTRSEENFSNFTPRAQQVLALSRKEADRFNHNFVGTEHLLLGLIALGQGVAVNVLLKLGLDLETVRTEVEKQVGKGPDQKMIGTIPFTPRVKKVLALANKERMALNHTYLGTEHILLGILREGDGVAARILRNLDINIEETREEILRELDPNLESRLAETGSSASQPLTPEIPADLAGAVSGCFMPYARRVVDLSHAEAKRLNHNFVGPGHLLLGIIKLGKGTAFVVLKKMGLELHTVRAELEKRSGIAPDQEITGNIPYAPHFKSVLALAAKEAKTFNHTYVGSEHILLALLRDTDNPAAQVLKGLDVQLEETQQEILKELEANKSTAQSTKPKIMTTKFYEPIDTSVRYDVYCRENAGKLVVYRNALFKNGRSLFPRSEHDVTSQFIELEQSNEQTIFISKSSLIRFCPHGVKMEGEELSGNKPE